MDKCKLSLVEEIRKWKRVNVKYSDTVARAFNNALDLAIGEVELFFGGANSWGKSKRKLVGRSKDVISDVEKQCVEVTRQAVFDGVMIDSKFLDGVKFGLRVGMGGGLNKHSFNTYFYMKGLVGSEERNTSLKSTGQYTENAAFYLSRLGSAAVQEIAKVLSEKGYSIDEDAFPIVHVSFKEADNEKED